VFKKAWASPSRLELPTRATVSPRRCPALRS
jgi:hypothetical protein